MIKKTLAILTIGTAIFAHAQDISTIKNTYDVYGSSLPGTSKFNSMAGSNGALGGDVNSLQTNPAGIGVSIASDISGTLYIGNSNNSTTLYGTTNDYKISKGDIGQLGGIATFELNGKTPWKFVNIAANFSSKSVEDYSESYGNNSIRFNLGNEQLDFVRHAYDRVGDISKMSVGVGGNYDNKIYAGVGIHVHSANINQSDTAQMIYVSDKTYDSFSKQYTPYTEDGNGFSANVGVIGKINNQFRLGASLETPTFWNIDRTYSYYDAVDSKNDGEYSEIRKISTPMKATLSVAYVPTKNLAVNIDYTIGVTKPKYKAEDSGVQQEFDDFYSSYKNQSEVRIGAEYRAYGFRFRGGYAFANNPFDTYTIITLDSANVSANQSFSDLFAGKRNTFGVGLGYDFKSFYVDAAYQNISSTYSNLFLRGSADAGSQYYSRDAFFANDAAVVSKVKNTQNNFSLTLGWKF